MTELIYSRKALLDIYSMTYDRAYVNGALMDIEVVIFSFANTTITTAWILQLDAITKTKDFIRPVGDHIIVLMAAWIVRNCGKTLKIKPGKTGQLILTAL